MRRKSHPWTPVASLAGMRAGVLVALAAVVAAGGCASGEDFGDRPSGKRARAEVEAELLAQAQSVAALAGSTVSQWRVETRSCDIAKPEKLWVMITRSELPVPQDGQVAALHAVRDSWEQERREFGDRRIAPDPMLADGDTGHLEAAGAFGDASVIGTAGEDHLDVIISSPCYDAVRGEDPARG